TRCYRDWSSDVCSSDLPITRGSLYAGRLKQPNYNVAGLRWRQMEGGNFKKRCIRLSRHVRSTLSNTVSFCTSNAGGERQATLERSEERRVGKECGDGRR